jgi:hypothetical protein
LYFSYFIFFKKNIDFALKGYVVLWVCEFNSLILFFNIMLMQNITSTSQATSQRVKVQDIVTKKADAPIRRYSINTIKAALFNNKTKIGDRKSFNLQRSYMINKNGNKKDPANWGLTKSFRIQDINKIIAILETIKTHFVEDTLLVNVQDVQNLESHHE